MKQANASIGKRKFCVQIRYHFKPVASSIFNLTLIILVQNQQWRRHSNVQNMFKVNKEHIRMMFLRDFGTDVFMCVLWNFQESLFCTTSRLRLKGQSLQKINEKECKLPVHRQKKLIHLQLTRDLLDIKVLTISYKIQTSSTKS